MNIGAITTGDLNLAEARSGGKFAEWPTSECEGKGEAPMFIIECYIAKSFCFESSRSTRRTWPLQTFFVLDYRANLYDSLF